MKRQSASWMMKCLTLIGPSQFSNKYSGSSEGNTEPTNITYKVADIDFMFSNNV